MIPFRKILPAFLLLISFCAPSLATKCPLLFQVMLNHPPVARENLRTPSERNLGLFLTRFAPKWSTMVKQIKPPRSISKDQFDSVIGQASVISEELLKNAAMWGNKFDTNKSITLELFETKDGILIVVQDQGEKAFDPWNDPASRNWEESQEALAARRAQLGKKTEQGVTEGVFWAAYKRLGLRYLYDYDNGSTVGILVPWNLSSKN